MGPCLHLLWQDCQQHSERCLTVLCLCLVYNDMYSMAAPHVTVVSLPLTDSAHV
jgi:hypothetical protein